MRIAGNDVDVFSYENIRGEFRDRDAVQLWFPLIN